MYFLNEQDSSAWTFIYDLSVENQWSESQTETSAQGAGCGFVRTSNALVFSLTKYGVKE